MDVSKTNIQFDLDLYFITRNQIYASMECKNSRNVPYGSAVKNKVHQDICMFIAIAYIYDKTKNPMYLESLDKCVSAIRHCFCHTPTNDYFRQVFEKDKCELFDVSYLVDAKLYFGNPPVISRRVVEWVFDYFEHLNVMYPGN